MGNVEKQQPYITLGKHLRYLREQQSESLADVSGAVEIDEKTLARIEAGHERPAEEILMLLISHFNMQDQEAVQLWELAGYDGTNDDRTKQEELLQEALSSGHKPVVLVFGMDGRTLYSDMATVNADNAGIVINFGQINGKKQLQSLARIGMSYDQAHQVLKQLEIALLKGKHDAQPRRLPPTIDPTDN